MLRLLPFLILVFMLVFGFFATLDAGQRHQQRRQQRQERRQQQHQQSSTVQARQK